MIPRYLVNFNIAELPQVETDFLVIGAGIAGLVAALNLAEDGRVTILNKEDLNNCNTEHAQGGIAAVISVEDTTELHYQDTMKAAAGLANPKAVKVLVNQGKSRIEDLIDLGVHFDTQGAEISLTKEGAHSCRRILHAGGDATGREIRSTLAEEVLIQKNIEVENNIFVVDLLTSEQRSYGVLAYDKIQEEYLIYRSKAVILATGGVGQLYSTTSNPKVATGDGIALAYRAGAKVMDLEFMQFHPTTLALSGVNNFLISEAVRGEGALLRNQDGERFMPNYHPLAELAPRDIVARAIYNEIQKSQINHVYLDLSNLDASFIKSRFPTIYRKCLDYGLDISREYIPVAPAAHYLMGGILTDLKGATTIKGLFACGEVACLGVHGANRLASNSLLDALVYGVRTAKNVIEYIKGLEYNSIQLNQHQEVKKELREDSTLNQIKDELQELLTKRVGIIREESQLTSAQEKIKELTELLSYNFANPADWELQNLITIAQLTIRAALLREESRGAHYRRGFSQKQDLWQKHILFQREKEWEGLEIEFK